MLLSIPTTRVATGGSGGVVVVVEVERTRSGWKLLTRERRESWLHKGDEKEERVFRVRVLNKREIGFNPKTL